MNHPTTQYALDICEEKIKACEWEILACKRHLKDLERQGTERFPFVFDESRANRIFDWFKLCRHVRGAFAGKPIELEPFQKFDKGSIFGWVNMNTGARRFTDAYEERARGNVKSTEMSGVVLYGMCADCIYPPGKENEIQFEIMPECETAAIDKQQAMRVWGDAKEMALHSPDISKRLNISKSLKITHKTRGGWLRPLSKDLNNKDSGAPCIVIIDEYHKHKTSEIKDTLRSGFGKRKQSLIDVITTAGIDAENSPAKRERDACCKILLGEFEAEHVFAMIRELDKDDDPHDESNWVKANPILQSDNEYSRGLLKEIRSEHDVAYGSNDPGKIREFLTKRCCMWQSDSEDKYFSGQMDKWKKLSVSKSEFFRMIGDIKPYVGIDLSKTTDLTAIGNVFVLPNGYYAIDAHGFMPSERASQHENSDRVPYKQWAKEGWCTLTEGSVTDYNYIKDYIIGNQKKYGWQPIEFAYDPYNATHFIKDLSESYNEDQFVEIRQGVQTLSEPTKKIRELVLQGKIIHLGNPLLAWCLSNAIEVVDNNGNIKLSKKHRDDSQRIDLLAAIINAFCRALMAEDKTTVYSTRGILSL